LLFDLGKTGGMT